MEDTCTLFHIKRSHETAFVILSEVIRQIASLLYFVHRILSIRKLLSWLSWSKSERQTRVENLSFLFIVHNIYCWFRCLVFRGYDSPYLCLGWSSHVSLLILLWLIKLKESLVFTINVQSSAGYNQRLIPRKNIL